MKKWMLLRKSADFDSIAKKYGISPFLARVIRNRDIVTDEEINAYLNGTLDDMHNPFLMKDMEKAASFISDAILNNKKIRIVGDYDIDGVCATAILVKSLSFFGADVSYRLPDRIVDGYGINITMIDEAKADNVDLIVTCDNGIAASAEMKYAKELGIDVIVTDHHEIPFEEINGGKVYIIPDAIAVVDPHQENDTYPFAGICGGMVAYKLILAINNLGKLNKNISPDLKEYITTLAAFATVGDIMQLKDENRIVVKHGIDMLKRTTVPGLRALIDVTETKRERISAYTIGFVLGPCVNAVGRLESANKALELLLTDDNDTALSLAKELKSANDVRKAMMEQKIKEASDIVTEGIDNHDYSKDTVLVIFLENCHESIAGLVASRIRERFSKPTLVITSTEGGAKGSGRSIDAYNMFEELTKVKHLFTKFGGHPMAAGLSMPVENIDELRKLLNENSTLTEDDLVEKLSIDIDMPINYVTMDMVKELSLLEPFGNGNPGPVFAQKNLEILSRRTTKNRNMVFFNLKSGAVNNLPEKIIEAKYFGDADEVFSNLSGRDTITVAYTPDINSYMGVDTLQISIREYL
ncbi:MAG: single-stranded-DNA-specific exonuclease RecJ [Lachnospiraceae bacterium]|nr:single-stranded-DNA-specific exonuclease RecJ [Lachnospiraceae bacterium]